MKTVILSLVIMVLNFGCASKQPVEAARGLEIIEIEPNKWTALTKQNLFHLAKVYDLEPLIFVNKIHIQSGVMPKSHPIILLNTRNAENPRRLLSSFLHEQLHWWTEANQKKMNSAVKELKKNYPKAPVNRNSNSNSTYIHLIICYLEYRSLAFYLGEKESREVISATMKKDKLYPWVYYQVLNKEHAIKKVVQNHKLLPPPIN